MGADSIFESLLKPSQVAVHSDPAAGTDEITVDIACTADEFVGLFEPKVTADPKYSARSRESSFTFDLATGSLVKPPRVIAPQQEETIVRLVNQKGLTTIPESSVTYGSSFLAALHCKPWI